MAPRDDILLIGGNGFLGLALAQALAGQGRRPHILSRTSEPGESSGIVFHRGSQDDQTVVEPLLRVCGTVVHLASTTTPGSSARRPVVDIEENLLPAARLVEMMNGRPPRRLVFVSSGGAIYGNPASNPVDESSPPRPLSYHAAGKLAMEGLFGAFAHAKEVPLTVIRLSNLYGPRQPLRRGFGLVRTLLDRTARQQPVEVWGDGHAVRDYVYVDDAVSACLALLASPQGEGLFNLGSGQGTSIREMLALIEQVTGHCPTVRERPGRETDVKAVVLDCRKLAEAVGWQPRVGLEQGLRQTWEWVLREAQ